VLGDVPRDQRCRCREETARADAGTRDDRSLLARLFGR